MTVLLIDRPPATALICEGRAACASTSMVFLLLV